MFFPIVVLPFYHPVQLAEQHAVLDILSNGRLDVGISQVGQTFDLEFRMRGVNPMPRPSLYNHRSPKLPYEGVERPRR